MRDGRQLVAVEANVGEAGRQGNAVDGQAGSEDSARQCRVEDAGGYEIEG